MLTLAPDRNIAEPLPSISRLALVTQLARSDARNAMTSAAASVRRGERLTLTTAGPSPTAP